MTDRTTRWSAAIALLVIAALLYMEARHLDREGVIHPNGTALALLVLAGATVVTLMAPRAVRNALGRVESFEALGVSVTLSVERATRASLEAGAGPVGVPDVDDGVKVSERPRTGDPVTDLDAVADVIRKRIRFMRDAVLRDPSDIPEDVMVARFAALGLLPEHEVKTIRDVLGDVRDSISEWPADEREQFLEAGWRYGTRLATTLFDRYVRRELTRNGWFVADFEQSKGHRRDFLATHGDTWCLVAARVGAPASGVDATRTRLAKARVPAGVDARIVVIPDREQGAQEVRGEPVKVVKLGNLVEDPTLVEKEPVPG